MKGFTLLFLLAFGLSINAQGFNGLYGIDSTAYGSAEDYVNDLIFNPTTQHTFVAGFLKRSPIGGGTVQEIGTLSHFDENGNLIYSKTTSFEEIHSVVRTPEGHLLLTGRGTGLLCNGVCKADYWVAEADEDGQFLWGRSFGNLVNDGNDIGYAGAIMSNGDRLTVGYYYHTTYNSKVFIARLTSQGDTVWTKSYGMYSGQQCGYSVYVDSNDDIYIGGTTTVGGGLLLMKLTSSGTLTWAKTYVTPAGRILKIFKKSDGTFLLCGQAIANGDYMVNLTNVDANGSLLWSKEYGVENSDNETFFEDAYMSPNGELYLTGYYYDEVNYVFPGNRPYYVKLDALGNVLWAKRYTTYYGEGRVLRMHPSNNLLWGGIHMQNAFTQFWAKQPESWWSLMGSNGNNDCFTACTMTQNNSVASASPKNFYAFTGYTTDNPIPSSTSYLTFKTPKCSSPLGVLENEEYTFEINPNPSTGQVILTTKGNLLGKINIINEQGQQVLSIDETSKQVQLCLKSGVYFIRQMDFGTVKKLVIVGN